MELWCDDGCERVDSAVNQQSLNYEFEQRKINFQNIRNSPGLISQLLCYGIESTVVEPRTTGTARINHNASFDSFGEFLLEIKLIPYSAQQMVK